MVETGVIQFLDPVDRQQITIADQTGQNSVFPAPVDDVVQLRMQKRFAPADDQNG